MKKPLSLLPLLLAPFSTAFADPAACPEAGTQLTEYLASAKQRIVHDGQVRVEFDVDADGRPRLVALDGSRVYRTPVRIAMQSLDCRPGTPQRYVLNIRFADPVPPSVAASAAMAQAGSAPPNPPR